jgi:acetyl esterase/lipase
MPYKEPLLEENYGRNTDNRNDAKWSHPELTDWWAAGNADVVNMCCDEDTPLEKRQKRLKKMIDTSTNWLEGQGYLPFEGKDFGEGNGFGVLKSFACHGTPEEGADAEHEVYAVIPNQKSRKPRGVIYFVMGGCFFMQEPSLYPELLRWAARFNVVVVSPRYSTLLDARYPTQINEAHAGYIWMQENAEMLGVNPDNAVLFGLSTGAHLALSLAFRLKRYGVTPKGCVLADPMIEDRNIFESSKIIKDSGDARLTHTLFTSYVGFENCGTNYIGPEAFGNHATADECKGLCPVFLHVGESDQDRDPAMDFISKLHKARVPASLHVWLGAAHATLWNSSGTSMSERFFNILYGDIKDCLSYDLRRPWVVN